MKRYKKWLVGFAMLMLVYCTWGYFGFAGAWIPGKYDTEKKEYKVLWGWLGSETVLPCNRGMCRIIAFTPFIKQGLIDSTGKVIIPFSYDQTNGMSKFNIMLVSDNDKWGVVSLQNNIIVPTAYDYISFLENGDILLTKLINQKKVRKLVDKNGKEIVPLAYSSIFFPSIYSRKPFIIAERERESYFIFDETKKRIINKFFTVEFLVLMNQTVLINGFLSKDLNPNHTISTDRYTNSYEKYKKAKINETDWVNHYYGLFDSNGKALLPLTYDFISVIKDEKFALVEKNYKIGIYDIQKKIWITPFIYSNIEELPENLHLFMLQDYKNKKIHIDENGTVILSEKVKIKDIDTNGTYLIFHKNRTHYKLYYNKGKQKFIWYKL